MSQNEYFPFGSPDPTSSQLEEIAQVEINAHLLDGETDDDYAPFGSPDPTPSQLGVIARMEDELTASTSNSGQQGGGQLEEVRIKTLF